MCQPCLTWPEVTCSGLPVLSLSLPRLPLGGESHLTQPGWQICGHCRQNRALWKGFVLSHVNSQSAVLPLAGLSLWLPCPEKEGQHLKLFVLVASSLQS